MDMKKFGTICCFVLMNINLFASPASRSDTLDIRKTKIEMNITDFVSKNIIGKSSLLIKSKMNNVQQVLLDIEGLSVDSVISSGQSLAFTHTFQTLNIQLPNTLNQNDSVLLNVYYHGVPIADPQWGGLFLCWQLCFSNGGLDSMLSLILLVERGILVLTILWKEVLTNFQSQLAMIKMAVCNGLLIDSISNPDNTITWHWKLDEEIPSYLASVAVCNYVFVKKSFNRNQWKHRCTYCL